jgi:hypothetical protein
LLAENRGAGAENGTGIHRDSGTDRGTGANPGDSSYRTGANPGTTPYHAVPMTRSGLLLEGEIRDSKVLRTKKGPVFVFSRHDSTLVFYRPGP